MSLKLLLLFSRYKTLAHLYCLHSRQAYHARLTRLLAGAGGDGEQWSIFSDAEKAVLDSVAEALGLSKGQVRLMPIFGNLVLPSPQQLSYAR